MRKTIVCERPRGRDAGYSLLEVGIAVGLGATLLTVLGNILISTTDSMDYMVKDSITLEDIKETVNTVTSELQSSQKTSITIISGANYDTITLQVYRDPPGATPPSYGAEDQSGAFNTGWSIRYRVTAPNLLREVLDGGGTVRWSMIVAEDVDTAFGGQKGFAVVKNGNLYSVNLRIQKTFEDQNYYRKSMGSTVFVKN